MSSRYISVLKILQNDSHGTHWKETRTKIISTYDVYIGNYDCIGQP